MHTNPLDPAGRRPWLAGLAVLLTVTLPVLLAAGHSEADERRLNQLDFANDSGVLRTITTASGFDTSNPFFQELGTNGRTCFSCHRPAQAWTVTPGELRERFARTNGLDPIFRTNDGSTCEGADVSTLGKRRRAFSTLLSKGLIRVGIHLSDEAEFEVVAVDDPYKCGALLSNVSTFRRILPSTNLGFLSTVMWDGRETVKGLSMRANLQTQAADATTGHAEGPTPSPEQVNAIVDFESGLFTAQIVDRGAGHLQAHGGRGGPRALSTEPFCVGINDPLGMLPVMPGACPSASTALNTEVFTVFKAWRDQASPDRRAIARGEQIFNTRTFVIDRVGGLNGAPSDPVGGPIQGATCTLCHDTPNAGNHSVSMPLNLGLADLDRRTPDLPLYTLENKTTHDTLQTTDPGRAMVTGKWADIGRFKGPVLRALASRAPYFHNGSAATLEEAVNFYNTRFNINLTRREKSDLLAFLRAL